MISVHYILFDRFGYNATLSIYICKTRVMNWIDKSSERYNIFGFGLWAVCLKDNGEMIGDCGLTMQIINNQIKPEIEYHFRKDIQHKGYAKEATIAVRDWTFINTPFNTVYSYMKKDNIASTAVAVSYGCKKLDEFIDSENETTVVYGITRIEWEKIQNIILYKNSLDTY